MKAFTVLYFGQQQEWFAFEKPEIIPLFSLSLSLMQVTLNNENKIDISNDYDYELPSLCTITDRCSVS